MISIDEGQWKRLCRRIGADWRYTPQDVVIDSVIDDLTAYGKLLRKEANRNRRKAINKVKIDFPKDRTALIEKAVSVEETDGPCDVACEA